MPFAPGDKLGPYEIVTPIGKGGMGEVFRARDSRLNRDVAIKVSSEKFSERFEREARAIAQLNHPNICHLYDVGPNYLVMELVEGEDLKGPLTFDDALPIIQQLIDGIEAAHEKNIVHRDLKPANIKITPEGAVKILDFGLAKTTDLAPSTDPSNSPTQTMGGTVAGTILGTAAYMSPEQAKGKQADKRSDVWSFGVVVYELLTGQRLFTGESVVEILGAVLNKEPDLSAAPPRAHALLRWCLERDRKRRLAAISDARHSLAVNPVPAPSRDRQGAGFLWPAIAAVAILAGAAAFFLAPRPSPAPDLSSYKFTPLSRDEATERSPAWSPDGKSIAYTASINGVQQIFTRTLGSSEAAQITRFAKDAIAPHWSPDGSTIYYLSGNSSWAVGATGGTPELLFERVTGAYLHPDGKTFLLFRGGKPYLAQRGGELKEVFVSKEINEATGNRAVLGFSPDGSKLAMIVGGDLFIRIYPFTDSPSDLQRIPMGGEATSGSWMPDSRRVVVQVGSQPFSLVLVDASNSAQRVVYSSPDAILNPAVSPDGKRIAYSAGRTEWSLLEIGIPDGHVRTLRSPGGVSWYPAWAPSGTHYLYASDASGHWTIEDASAGEEFSRRVAEVDEASSLMQPLWAPDGKRFTFNWGKASGSKTMLSNASGGQMAPLDPTAPGEYTNPVWSPDGQWIVYTRSILKTREVQIARIRPGSTSAPEILATYQASKPETLRGPFAWSGDWILASNQRTDLYLISPDFKTERKINTRPGGQVAGFSRDGRQMIGVFRNTTGQGAQWQLYSLDVATFAERKLADLDLPVTVDNMRGFSMHPDGTRFATSIAKWPFDLWVLEGFDTK